MKIPPCPRLNRMAGCLALISGIFLAAEGRGIADEPENPPPPPPSSDFEKETGQPHRKVPAPRAPEREGPRSEFDRPRPDGPREERVERRIEIERRIDGEGLRREMPRIERRRMREEARQRMPQHPGMPHPRFDSEARGPEPEWARRMEQGREAARGERRERHLREAVEHLRAAGWEDIARKVEEAGRDRLRSEPPRRAPGRGDGPDAAQHLRERLRELREALNQLDRDIARLSREEDTDR